MRAHFFLFAASCLFTTLAYSKDNVQIRGHIDHPLADSILVSYNPASIVYNPSVYKAKLNNGNFSLSFNVPEGYTQLTIQNGMEGTELFVEPGADLTLTIDAANFDSTIHYEGKGKEIANYCTRCILEKHSVRDLNMTAQHLSGKDPNEYEAALRELLERENDYLEKSGRDLPQSFKDYRKTANQYEVYYTMHMYPRSHEVLRQNKNNIKEIPKENYVVIDHIPALFNDNYLNMQAYRSYLGNFYGMRVMAEFARTDKKPETGEWADSVFARSYREMPPLTAEYFVGSRIYNSLSHTPIEQIMHQFAGYRAQFPNSRNTAILEEAIDRKRLVGPGKPEIDFDITTPEGKQMKLSDLKGKVVYIDFWSRHCVPCIAEMKEAAEIRKHFKDKPVAFVYVSEDEDESTWKTAIKDFNIEGINTHLEKGRFSDVVQKYEAGAIPVHYLVDRDGKFAKVARVATPTEKEQLISQIGKLLE